MLLRTDHLINVDKGQYFSAGRLGGSFLFCCLWANEVVAFIAEWYGKVHRFFQI